MTFMAIPDLKGVYLFSFLRSEAGGDHGLLYPEYLLKFLAAVIAFFGTKDVHIYPYLDDYLIQIPRKRFRRP